MKTTIKLLKRANKGQFVYSGGSKTFVAFYFLNNIKPWNIINCPMREPEEGGKKDASKILSNFSPESGVSNSLFLFVCLFDSKVLGCMDSIQGGKKK